MKKYDLYLFDFDGTLLNTLSSLEYVFTYSYGKIGINFKPEDTVLFSRVSLQQGYEIVHANPDDWPLFCDTIEASLDFPEALKRNEPYAESMEFFKYLEDHKILAGIVTSNKQKHVKDVLTVMGVDTRLFTVYMGSKQYENYKPHPEPILKALEAFGYKGPLDKVVYVGDGMNDMECAINAGVDAVLVDRINAFEESNKYIKIKNLMELFN